MKCEMMVLDKILDELNEMENVAARHICCQNRLLCDYENTTSTCLFLRFIFVVIPAENRIHVTMRRDKLEHIYSEINTLHTDKSHGHNRLFGLSSYSK